MIDESEMCSNFFVVLFYRWKYGHGNDAVNPSTYNLLAIVSTPFESAKYKIRVTT